MQKEVRLKRELSKIRKSPPPGIDCHLKGEELDVLEANITGPEGSPFEGGIFKIDIHVNDKYPFQPPLLRFTTKVYHPNIDLEGRICLDLLKMPPNGNWKPTYGIEALLIAVQMLLANPNPDDPLMAEIAEEYRCNKEEYELKAKEYTKKFATQI